MREVVLLGELLPSEHCTNGGEHWRITTSDCPQRRSSPGHLFWFNFIMVFHYGNRSPQPPGGAAPNRGFSHSILRSAGWKEARDGVGLLEVRFVGACSRSVTKASTDRGLFGAAVVLDVAEKNIPSLYRWERER